LRDQLVRIRPLDHRPEHAWAHAHIWDQRARRIVVDPVFGFAVDDVEAIMSSYEMGLIAALDVTGWSGNSAMKNSGRWPPSGFSCAKIVRKDCL